MSKSRSASVLNLDGVSIFDPLFIGIDEFGQPVHLADDVPQHS